MKKFVLLIVLTLFVSCKKEKKNNVTSTIVEEIEQNDTFKLVINAIIENDDEFRLYYLEEGQKGITNQNSVIVDVLGSPLAQELNFKIKEEILPTRLFLMFRKAQKAQKISLLTTEISYGEDSFIIEKEKFYQFFRPNHYIDYDTENAIAITKEVKGKYEPWFGSRQGLIDKIYLDFQ